MRSLLKRLRYAQPFNRILTSAVRELFRLLRRRVPDPIVAHLHRVGEMELRAADLPAITIYSEADDFVPNQAWWWGLAEVEPDAVLFARLARDADTILDVGAYIGVYSLLAARANPGARMLAFEPFPRNRERLQTNLRLSRVANVEVRGTAVGSDDGEAIYHHIDAPGLPSSAGLSPVLLEGYGEISELPVPVETIDGLLDAGVIDSLDLLKLDTEGTEPDVLAGAERAIRRFQPPIICEVLADTGVAKPLEALLGPLGYRFLYLGSAGPRLMASIEAEPGSEEGRNYLFLPERIEVAKLPAPS